MDSITINLVSKRNNPPIPFCIPVINFSELDNRINCFIQSRGGTLESFKRTNYVLCRELFQSKSAELFFIRNRLSSYGEMGQTPGGRVFVLRDSPCWSFFLCFIPNFIKVDLFKEIQFNPFYEGFFPAGVSYADHFDYSNTNISILTSNSGWLEKVNNSYVLKGIELAILEKGGVSQGSFHRGLFCKKVEVLSHLERPLRRDLVANKYVKINCLCRKKNFSFRTKVSVLSTEELKQEIRRYLENSPQLLNEGGVPLETAFKKEIFFNSATCPPQIFCFPAQMSLSVPFNGMENGRLVFCYEEDVTEGKGFKICFFPTFSSEIRKKHPHRAFPFWQTDSDISFKHFVSSNKISIFRSLKIKLIQASEKEFEVQGAECRLISTTKNGCWGLFVSLQAASTSISTQSQTSSSSATKSSRATSRPHPYRNQQDRARPTATVSVPPDREGEQQAHMSFQIPLSMGVPFFPPLASSIRSPMGSSSETGGPASTGASATVFVPPDREGEQQAHMSFQIPLSMGAPFFPPLASSIRPPMGSSSETGGPASTGASATVSVPPDREGEEQTQMDLTIPFFPPLASSVRPPIGSSSEETGGQAAAGAASISATASVPPDREGEVELQWNPQVSFFIEDDFFQDSSAESPTGSFDLGFDLEALIDSVPEEQDSSNT